MFLWSLYYVIDSYRRIVTLDDDGLTIHRSFLGAFRIEWTDIQSVTFFEPSWKFKIQRIVGSSARISGAMNGLGTLVCYLDRYAPDTITPEARRLLPVHTVSTLKV